MAFSEAYRRQVDLLLRVIPFSTIVSLGIRASTADRRFAVSPRAASSPALAALSRAWIQWRDASTSLPRCSSASARFISVFTCGASELLLKLIELLSFWMSASQLLKAVQKLLDHCWTEIAFPLPVFDGVGFVTCRVGAAVGCELAVCSSSE